MLKGQLSEEDRQEIVRYGFQMFGKAFLKNSIVDKRFGKTFNQLFSLRMTGDYEDRHIIDMDTEVMPLVKPAKELIDVVSEMAKNHLGI